MIGDRFSPDALAKAVHATLDEATAAIPEGHTRALILDGTYTTADGPSVRGMYMQRSAEGWQVVIAGAYDGKDGPSAGFAVSRSWK